MTQGALEVAAAALLPAAAALLLARWSGDRTAWRVMARWFVPLALVWMMPCWLTGRSPVAWGFLHTSVPPWTSIVLDEPGGTPQLHDVPMQFAPWRETVTRSWLSGEMPWLDRHAAAGSTLWANPQALVVHPLTLAGLPFSTFAWFVFIATAKLLAGLAGMFLFLRREGISERASIFGSIAWGFSAFSIAWLLFPHTNVTMLLPWLLAFIRSAVTTDSWRAAAGGGLVLALMCAGGHPESVAHSAVIALPYAASLLFRKDRSGQVPAMLRLGAIGIVGVLLAAPLLVPFALALPTSERVARWIVMPRFLTAPAVSVDSLSPFFSVTATLFGRRRIGFSEFGTQYAGLLTMALALWRASRAPREERVWLGIFGVSALLAWDWPLSRWLTSAPLARDMLHGRLRFVLAFVAALLAAKAIDDVASATARRGAALWIGLGSAAALATVALAWHDVDPGAAVAAAATAVVPVLCALEGIIILRQNGERFRQLAPMLLVADLAASLWFFNAPVSRRLAYPPTPGTRAIAADRGPERIAALANALLPNSAAMLGVEDVGAHDPMAWNPYLALIRRGGYYTKEYFSQWSQVPPRLLLDYLGVTRIVTPSWYEIEGYPSVYAGPDLRIYRNDTALPRAFVPSSVVTSPRPVSTFTLMRTATDVVVGSGTEVRAAPARVTIEHYGQNGESIRVDAPGETFVATSEPAIPGWRLERDGTSWPLIRVNGVFLGWRVPPPGGRFSLHYVPPGLEIGLALCGLGLLTLAGLMLADRRAQQRRG